MHQKINTSLFLILLIGQLACKSEDPVPVNEEELITTLIYELIPDDGGDVVRFMFRDLDGEGGNPPEIIEGKLNGSTIYSCNLILLNEQVVPLKNITEEVKEEGDAHQFFFNTSSSNIQILYNDMDINGFPIGIKTSAQTKSAGKGTLTIILRHEPTKSGDGVSDGDITNAGGETDIEVSFHYVVE